MNIHKWFLAIIGLAQFLCLSIVEADSVNWQNANESFTVGQQEAYAKVSAEPPDITSEGQCDCDEDGNPVNFECHQSEVVFESGADANGKINTSQPGPVTVTVSLRHYWRCPGDPTKTKEPTTSTPANNSATFSVGTFRVAKEQDPVEVGETATFTLRDADDMIVEADSWESPVISGLGSWIEAGTYSVTAYKDESSYTTSIDVVPGFIDVDITSPSDKVVWAGTPTAFETHIPNGTPPYEFNWNFENGSPNNSTSEKPTVTYDGNAVGATNEVTVNVKDANGKTGTGKASIAVPHIVSIGVDESDANSFDISYDPGVVEIASVKGSGDVKLKAIVSPDTPEVRNKIVWDGATADTTDKRIATVSRSDAARHLITVGISSDDPNPRLAGVSVVWANVTKFINSPTEGRPPTCSINSPPGNHGADASTTHNGMVIEFKLLPEGFGDTAKAASVTFDIKRLIAGGSWMKTSGTWANNEAHPMYTDDDGDNDDEDLIPESDLIYGSDNPGPIFSPGPGQEELAHIFNALEFVEIVFPGGTQSGKRCSDDYEWHSEFWLKRSTSGSWQRNMLKTNAIVPGHRSSLPTGDDPN